MRSATLPGFLEDEGLRLLLFGGKGGVGKTTCAAAAALYLARQHPTRSFLLVSTDPAHSLADSFAGPSPLGNLTLCEMNPQDSLARFKARHAEHLRTIALRGTFLDEADVTQLLDLSMPGLDEIMALLEIAAWVKEERYACIVVDTAPAGHTLRLLGLPAAMRQWVAALDAMLAKHRYMVQRFRGAYRKEATDLYLEETAAEIEALRALLTAPGRCRFVPVMLAEKLSLEITRMMVAELEKLNLPVREMVVNRLAPAEPLTLPSPITRCIHPLRFEEQWVPESNGSPGEGSDEGECPDCATRASMQAVAIEELKQAFPRYTLWGLPLFLEEVRGVERLTTVWEHARPLETWGQAPAGKGDSPWGNSPRAGACPRPGAAVSTPAPLPSPSMRLLMFAGKGGVGKTTLACASALRLAEEWGDKKILLFSIDPAHSLSACLGQEIGPQKVRVTRGLTAIEVNAQAEFERLKKDYSAELAQAFERVTEGTAIDLTFDQEVMERIMDLSPPGLDEVLALTRIVELLDQGRYDLFVLDTAPTGHLLRFLEMPELIEEWLRTFFGLFLKYREVFRLPRISLAMVELSKRVKQFRRVLTDPDQAALVAVTIPTEMAYAETSDLVAACERLGVAVPILFVNMVTPVSRCPTCSALRREEEPVLRRYEEAFAGRHCTVVSRQSSPRGVARLSALGGQLYRSGARGGTGQEKVPVPFPETQFLMIS